MIKKFFYAIRKKYLELFPSYKILESKYCTYMVADKLIRETKDKPEEEQWDINTKYEDGNRTIGWVFICRKKRILLP